MIEEGHEEELDINHFIILSGNLVNNLTTCIYRITTKIKINIQANHVVELIGLEKLIQFIIPHIHHGTIDLGHIINEIKHYMIVSRRSGIIFKLVEGPPDEKIRCLITKRCVIHGGLLTIFNLWTISVYPKNDGK